MTIDFHAHILPGCDHGSSGLDVSLKQLELAKQSGVDVVCATSHFYPDRENVHEFLERRNKCYEELMAARQGINELPKLLLGAEILACAGLEKIPGLETLCLEGTNILLIEMPFIRWQSALVEMMEELSYMKDFRPVLAHADRYDPDDVEQILDMGIPVQLNVENLSGMFIKKHIKDWIDRGVVVAFGSDIHGTDTGYRKWDKVKKRLGGDWDEIMAVTNEMITK